MVICKKWRPKFFKDFPVPRRSVLKVKILSVDAFFSSVIIISYAFVFYNSNIKKRVTRPLADTINRPHVHQIQAPWVEFLVQVERHSSCGDRSMVLSLVISNLCYATYRIPMLVNSIKIQTHTASLC